MDREELCPLAYPTGHTGVFKVPRGGAGMTKQE